MNILLVEDEAGIREGLATFLQLKGHVVQVADSCARGEAMLAEGSFDLVVTDWRLGDGLGAAILQSAGCPVVVMTGYPQEVTDPGGHAVVLRKPVSPQALLAEIDKHARADADDSRAARLSDIEIFGLDRLPQDARDRIALACAITGGEEARVQDDGEFVILDVALRGDENEVLARIACLGGDHRVLASDDGPRLELRWFRDGHPTGCIVVGFEQAWPASPTAVAVDMHGASCHPDAFVQLVEEVSSANASGRTVHILNIPTHQRLYLETLGLGHLLPNRPKSGPRLPEVLMELWRDE